MKVFVVLYAFLSVAIAACTLEVAPPPPLVRTCTIQPSGNASIDDAPAIVAAFQKCRKNGLVVFLNETYHINTVMNTTGLENVEVDLKGTLLVS